MLDSPEPSIILWSSDLIQIYNDAYRPILDLRHPVAMGQPTQACWPEVWYFNEPIYRRVLHTRQSVHLEDQEYVIEPSGVRETRYFTITYAPVRDENAQVRGVAVVAIKTTRRVGAERDNIALQEKARAAADQQAFQLQLADRLRSLDTPEEVAADACKLLGERLGIWRVIFCEIDDAHGTFFIRSEWARGAFFNVAGKTNRLDDFGPENIAALRAGNVVVHNDIAIDTRTTAHRQAYEGFGIRANLAIPLVKSGALRVVLGLHHVEPHDWSPADIVVATDVAERTWAAAESARAHAELRAERDQSQYILDGMSEGFALIDRDWRMTQMNEAGLRASHRLWENVIGRTIWEAWPEVVGTDIEAMYRRVMASRVAENMESQLTFSDGHASSLEIVMYPALAGGVAVFFRDVSDRKRASEALNLKDVVASAVEQVRALMEKQRHDFSVSVSGEEIRVEGDRIRLVQILTNILNYAAKYTPTGGKIVLALTATEKHAQATVIDNGVGMSQELLPHIFDIFTQAERNADRVQGGLGLGLSLVKNLLALHGGTVVAKSAGAGMGSEFTVCLPLLKDPAQPGRVTAPPSVAVSSLPSMRILVVDDNVDAAKTLAMFLELDGHTVTVAYTAEDALAHLRAATLPPPQTFLLDIGLPGMDGYDLARLLRALPGAETATLVALTGYGQPQDRERSLAAGFNHHLEKPVDPESLLALLNRVDR